MRSLRRILLAGSVVVVAAATTTVVSNAAPGPAWGACPTGTGAGLVCTTLDVPLDYDHPDGRHIQLAVSRLASADPAHKRGVLLVNPGGPGLGGLGMPRELADPIPGLKQGLPKEVLDSYDIIGFDPRGIGHSTPLTCDLSAAEASAAASPPYPHGASDVLDQARAAKSVAGKCAASATSDLLPHITTANTARDMDRIRDLLGVPKISYYGASYGTYLGAVYASLFPQRSDRIVLDSNLGPNGYDVEALRDQGLGFQLRFPDFAKVAAADAKKYQLGATPAAVTAKYFDLAARLDKKAVQGIDGTTFRLITATYLRADGLLPVLAETWHDLDTDQPPPGAGAGTGEGGDNFAASYLAVVCGESAWPRSVLSYQLAVAVDELRYPMYGGESASLRPCASWPVRAAQPKTPITSSGAASVLMVQNLRDPATPPVLARQLRAAFGDQARLVTVDDGGHGVYQYVPNQCANDAVTDYLVTGHRPAHDAFCAAQPS